MTIAHIGSRIAYMTMEPLADLLTTVEKPAKSEDKQ